VNAASQRADRSGRDNAVGAVLIAAAVLVGGVLLAKGYDEEGSIVSAGGPTEETTTTTTVAVAPTTTVAASAARPPAEVSVFVANGAGVAGAAGKLTDQLKADGYTRVNSGNSSPVSATVVYYAEGAQAEASALADAIGVDVSAVQAMPANPPANAGDAIVLVVIGPDTAT
jgi:hypothetical protein